MHALAAPIPAPDCTWTQSDYAHQRPWAGFLPGIAGPGGTGMWVFTVNRGQGIAAMGVGGKDRPIMEFQPANRAWLETERTGFRTFLRLHRGEDVVDVEPFGPADRAARLTTDLNGLRLATTVDGVDVDVEYCTVSDEPFAALLRRVTLRNSGDAPVTVEVLDGLARLIPHGIDNGGLKEIGRTLEAWMQVEGADDAAEDGSRSAFFRLRASTGDAAEVSDVVAGNFVHLPTADRLFVDPTVVFGQATGLASPDGARALTWEDLLAAPQVSEGRTPCALAAHRFELAAGGTARFAAVVGHAPDRATFDELRPRLTDAWVEAQFARAVELGREITAPIATATANPVFDAYARQTYLDNVMRGGAPLRIGGRVIHLYGRKHGDLERDYNAFHLPPTPLPEGNANFRDLCQNRRSDVLFHPWVGDTNLRDFLGTLGLDGYNPLVLTGRRFRLDEQARTRVARLVERPEALSWPEAWAPGEALLMLRAADYGDGPSPDELLAAAVEAAEPEFSTDFAEGYWVDHWIYLLDLLDTHRSVFPDRHADLLSGPIDYHAAHGHIPSAEERWVLTDRGVRQYAHVTRDPEVTDDVVRDVDGEPVTTSVFGKLLGLAAVKAAALDAAGVGLEMEGGKPGWYDALNGLPGLLGSSLGEVRELRRLLRLLQDALDDGLVAEVDLPVEVVELVTRVTTAFRVWLGRGDRPADTDEDRAERDLTQWKTLVAARDQFRARTRLRLSGERLTLPRTQLADTLAVLRDRIDAAIRAAGSYAVGTMYLRFEVTGHEELGSLDAEGRPFVRPTALHPIPLPIFLEGAVHAMIDEPDRSLAIHEAITAGPLYDRPLGMYRVNSSLADETHEIGRARAFSPGWLENESIWLHMEYKYLLALLRAGEFEAFHEVFARAGVHAQDPARYGRSPLENSSFIASSAHPDENLHGAGFVARLSGATAEFCSMWHLLMAGAAPFVMDGGELVCRLRPALPGSWFDDAGQVRFAFVGTPVTVTNPERVDTWSVEPSLVRVVVGDWVEEFADGTIRGTLAEALRDGRVDRVEIVY